MGDLRAVIMAGGEGTRLRPLTSLRPKPMVPVVNRPVMEHIIQLVRRHGIEEVVATLQFMPQVIEDYFRDGADWGVRMTYALEETPLGTAGSVKNAREALDGTFIVISGDALTDFDLTEVIRFHREKGAAATLALKRVEDPLEFGIVITDDDGRIERFLEKPNWGQVFSDTINTGIYVLEPEVLDHIPDEGAYDFSSQLFPDLMEKGYDLFGAIVDGYWCDIGNLSAYSAAHRDILDGAVDVVVPGQRRSDGVWIGEGAEIHPDAELAGRAVIGSNVRIGPGARIGPYATIGDNSLVGADAFIERTVVWSDTVVGPNAHLSGAVVGQGVDLRGRVRLELDSVIGDETVIGDGAVVGNEVQVYPHKRIEAGATVTSSLIWESKGLRALFGTDGVSGLVGLDVTPEMALGLAQAYGSTLAAGSHVVVSRDTSTSARMIKRAVIAGLNSTGVHARDLRVTSPSISRFATRDTRCVGGIHIAGSQENPATLSIRFFDAHGMDLSPGAQKKAERLYFRGEFRRSFFDKVGEIIYPPHALEYYTAGVREALRPRADGRRMTVVADLGHGAAALVLPRIASDWGVELVALNPFLDAERTFATKADREHSDALLSSAVESFEADLGVSFDPSSERIRLVGPGGSFIPPRSAMHAVVDLWCRADDTDLKVAVPLTSSRVVEELARAHGHDVVRTGRSPRELSATAASGSVGLAISEDGGFILPRFLAAFDAVVAVGMIVGLLRESEESLDRVVERLPEHHLAERTLRCPASAKGAVMRAVMDEARGKPVELTEGVRVLSDETWALVLPHPADPAVQVFAEGASDEEAAELAERYAALVRSVVDEETV